MKKLLLVMFVGFCAACSPKVSVDGSGLEPIAQKKNQIEYQETPAAGAINNATWTYASGSAKIDYFDKTRLKISLSSETPKDACVAFNNAGVLTTVPNAITETAFGSGNPMQTATIFYQSAPTGSNNLIVTDGRIKITEITSTFVTGYIIANYDAANFVNGYFKVPFCAN